MGVHADTARQVEQTYLQIMEIAKSEGLLRKPAEEAATEARPPDETGGSSEAGLARALMTGFVDQLCVRRDEGTLICDLTEGRSGTLMRESGVHKAIFRAAGLARSNPRR